MTTGLTSFRRRKVDFRSAKVRPCSSMTAAVN
jgi:hypothetical protein